MKTSYKLEKNIKSTSVALGFFDGVHLGHRELIKNVVKCKENGLVPTVITFDKNPLEYFKESAKEKISYLTTNDEKADIFKSLGIEQLYFLDFYKIKDLTAYEFVSQILVDKLNAKKVFCGFNYHFGQGGNSTAQNLKEICKSFNIEVISISPVTYKDEVVSSTRIRKELSNANIEEVNNMLDRCFSYNFVIKKGNQIGRTIHTPTINQPFPKNFVLPKFGVYASAVEIEGKLYCGVTNIGVKPTIGKYNPLSETWVPQKDLKELYGEKVKVRLLKFLRQEIKFENIEKLHKQIVIDSQKAEKVFESSEINI